MSRINRRGMLKTSVLVGAGYWLGSSSSAKTQSPNEKLNIACIGIGGRGSTNVRGVENENIVALCDVDQKHAGKMFDKHPKAKRYVDFRKLLDNMEKEIDAVVVSTPDHTHFHPARMAMLMGKHCYCEKPLAHSVWECRELTNIAKKMKVATQLGNQRHAYSGMHRTVEAVQAGVIGEVKEVHSIVGGSRGMPAVPTEFPPVPEHLDWDLWLGPAKYRPYSPEYCPYNWRFWWDFGSGETGNWGCHIMDIPFWALGLKYPTHVAADGSPIDPQRTPKQMHVRYEFPATKDRGPVTLYWHHSPSKASELSKRYGIIAGKNNTFFIGEKGVIGAGFKNHSIEMFDDSTPETPAETIPESPGFYEEWITACKGGQPSTCDFVQYAGPLAEAVLLGNAAYRAGGGFDWDAEKFEASGNPNANEYIFPDFRDGWKV